MFSLTKLVRMADTGARTGIPGVLVSASQRVRRFMMVRKDRRSSAKLAMLLQRPEGSQLVELALCLPILMVFLI
jgi:hypothetical protein